MTAPTFAPDEVTTNARVVADSISDLTGSRLTTVVVTMHRFVLAEFNTHRMFSRSSASSRAIPVETQLAKVGEYPAFPLSYPAEQPGMQGGDGLEGDDRLDAFGLWSDIHARTVQTIDLYLKEHPDKSTRLHKSLINRLLEPFMWHTVVVTSTDWSNFYAQRTSPLAQPEIHKAAECMLAAMEASTPLPVNQGGWHTPFVGEGSNDRYLPTDLILSTARCARTSYGNHEQQRPADDDYKLFHRLGTADPAHAAPAEMVATPAVPGHETRGNFDGWEQLRHHRLLPHLIDLSKAAAQ